MRVPNLHIAPRDIRDLANTTRHQRRHENGVDMAAYLDIWMLPHHFHAIFMSSLTSRRVS